MATQAAEAEEGATRHPEGVDYDQSTCCLPNLPPDHPGSRDLHTDD